jgi:radical SAM superfamily enzyme YgiQ (UPF0313 family)
MTGGEFSFRLPPLGLMQIAGCTPAGHEVVLVDESVEPVDVEARADLVGFSVTTPNAPRTYAMARRFRERGIPVVFGGVHPTMVPEEAAREADAVVFREGDRIWPQVTGSGTPRKESENLTETASSRMAPPAHRSMVKSRSRRCRQTVKCESNSPECRRMRVRGGTGSVASRGEPGTIRRIASPAQAHLPTAGRALGQPPAFVR